MTKNKVNTPALKYFRKDYFEHEAWQAKKIVCGVDEVGRGCLAGPLVTAAVILPPGTDYRLLRDSKVMSLKDRLEAYAWITTNCVYSYGIVNHRVINRHNIWHATLIAMKRALLQVLSICPKKPSSILIDAMPVKLDNTPYAELPVYSSPFGESWSSSIAAASIIAKVKRDGLMGKFDTLLPGYHLAQHKGYSTLLHKRMLFEKYYSIIHRTSYLNKIILYERPLHAKQQTIF